MPEFAIWKEGFMAVSQRKREPRPKTIQLDWDIEGGRLHQIDYQLPIERKVESQMLYYTAMFGIGLGITNLAIYGADQRSRKIKEGNQKGDSK